jgi:hypothetical protein
MADTGDWDIAMESMKDMDEERNSDPKKSRRGYLLIVLILGVVIIVLGGVFVMSNITGTPQGTHAIPGDPANFNASTSLQEIQLFAGDDVRFIEMTMNQVRPDGTLDLNAKYEPSVEYVFVRQTGDNADYEYVIVTIKRSFGEVNRSNGDGGMSRSTRDVPASDVIPDRVVPPTCAIEDLWQIAKSYDVPIDNAVAVIQYTQDGYHFTMADEDVDLQFTAACVVVQS